MPGIPGSALRGMVSSIVEAATQSAFRVLDDRHFSYRRSMAEGRSALGMIVRKGNRLELYPMADPHLELFRRGGLYPQPTTSDFCLSDAIPKNSGNYEIMFKNSLRKIYFGDKPGIREKSFFDSFQSNQNETGGPFYAIPVGMVSEKIKSRSQGPQTTIFFDLGDQTSGLPESWDDEKHSEKTHIRGVLRVLGVYPEPDRRDPDAMPPLSLDRSEGMGSRKHEMFLPLSKQEEETLKNGSAVTFPILSEALERFSQLADERTAEADKKTRPEDLLPFTPHGQQRDWPDDPDTSRPRNAYHLKPGDLVFFRPTADGKSVAEVSLSSIWRGRVEKGNEGSKTAASLSDFIASLDPDLLPMGDPRKKNLTPAELLFGYVEHKGKRALAGRLRFSGAAPLEDQEPLLHSNWVDLQVLNNPKPPSPNFYFRKRTGKGHIAKSDLSLENHQIQGRKHYLHAQNASSATKPGDSRWSMHPVNIKSGKFDRMRVRVKPILAGKSFEFDVRFDNLSRFELGALLYALRPSASFHHKIGMGKPLGLGTVRVEPFALELINRRKRYAEDRLLEPRAISHDWSVSNDSRDPSFVEKLRAEFRSKMDQPTRTALEALGDPDKVTNPVHYPQIDVPGSRESAFETDRYEWFVSNDHKSNAKRQHLGQIAEDIPTLERLPKVERRYAGGARGPRPPHQPQRISARQENSAGGWRGPVTVTCKLDNRGSGWVFTGRDGGENLFGFLDRDAKQPSNLSDGAPIRMVYKRVSEKVCHFKPA